MQGEEAGVDVGGKVSCQAALGKASCMPLGYSAADLALHSWESGARGQAFNPCCVVKSMCQLG